MKGCIKNTVGLTVVILYVTTFVIAYLSPMQSDDFSFYFMGTSISTHWHFYMTWSGRVVADYISTLILAINHPVIIAVISSAALPLLIYNIATAPYYQEKFKPKKQLVYTLIILWFGYWLANPALGQTTFWVVGAANYLWPLVFVSFLFKYLLSCFAEEKISKITVFILMLLSLLSGCSNEATGSLVLYCLVLLYAWAWFNKLANRSIILLCFASAFMGLLVLLLAPGNMIRAANPAYAVWRSMAFDERLYNHFYEVMPSVLKGYGVIYLLLIWAFAQSYRLLQKKDYQLLIIWLSSTVVFSIILIASPHAVVARTHITGLFFLLMALSFLLEKALQQKVSKMGIVLFIALSITFISSYILVFLAYQSINKQSNIRTGIIEGAKARGEQAVVIPNYYKGFVLRSGDFPELDYHSADMMGRYYGVKAINLVFADFDYASLLNKPCETPYNRVDDHIQCIYTQTFLGSDTLRFVVKFDPKITMLEKEHRQFRLRVKNTFKPTDPNYYELTMPLRIIKVGDYYFASADMLLSLLGVKQDPALIVSVYNYDEQQPSADTMPSISIQVK